MNKCFFISSTHGKYIVIVVISDFLHTQSHVHRTELAYPCRDTHLSSSVRSLRYFYCSELPPSLSHSISSMFVCAAFMRLFPACIPAIENERNPNGTIEHNTKQCSCFPITAPCCGYIAMSAALFVVLLTSLSICESSGSIPSHH